LDDALEPGPDLGIATLKVDASPMRRLEMVIVSS